MAEDVKTLQGVTWASVVSVQGTVPNDLKTVQGVDVTGSSFVPTDIANCELWVKGELITGHVDGDPLSLWEDFSGNGNDEAQASGSNQPTYETNEVNGKSVVRFDGSSDFMTNSASLSQPCSIFAVVKVYNPALNGSIVGDNSIGGGAACYINPSGGFGVYAGSVVEETSGTTGWASYVGIINGASSEVYRNGSLVASGNAGVLEFPMGLVLGAYSIFPNGFLGTDLAEVAAYSTVITGTDIANLVSYSASEYGI